MAIFLKKSATQLAKQILFFDRPLLFLGVTSILISERVRSFVRHDFTSTLTKLLCMSMRPLSWWEWMPLHTSTTLKISVILQVHKNAYFSATGWAKPFFFFWKKAYDVPFHLNIIIFHIFHFFTPKRVKELQKPWQFCWF